MKKKLEMLQNAWGMHAFNRLKLSHVILYQ